MPLQPETVEQLRLYVEGWQLWLFPVRDKDYTYTKKNGDVVALPAKTPFDKGWQNLRLTLDELVALMEKYETSWVGIICGDGSGNLEVIDLDEKERAGISYAYMQEVKALHPNIYNRLRIIKTRTQGFHLCYRCEVPVSGNKKLAMREPTDKELQDNPKAKPKTMIETRGQGGFVVGPPSGGYEVVQNMPLPILTESERNALLSLAKQFSEVVEKKKEYKATKTQTDRYEVNPFKDFNDRSSPDDVMQEVGYKFSHATITHRYYTRPGKQSGVSMSFYTNDAGQRTFWCFSANGGFETETVYQPAAIIAEGLFNGDYKKLYPWLVEKGFGQYTKQAEKRIIKGASQKKNSNIPANLSNEAKGEIITEQNRLDELFPFGKFWRFNDDLEYEIDIQLCREVSEAMMYRVYQKDELVRIDDKYIYKVEQDEFWRELDSYIEADDAEEKRAIQSAFLKFKKTYIDFLPLQLKKISKTHIIQDSKTHCYKAYQNGLIEITAEGYQTIKQPVGKLIWEHEIKGRNFEPAKTGRYITFIEKALGLDDYVMKVSGWLADKYKTSSTAYMVAAVEAIPEPENGGGSGKNIYGRLFEHITTYFQRTGHDIKQVDSTLLQAWAGQAICCISDPKKNLDWEAFKQPSEGEMTVKYLYKNEVVIPSEDTPKFFVPTNYYPKLNAGGMKRRVIILEFSDFFTIAKGVDVYFNNDRFPDDWTKEDWQGFDWFMANGIMKWKAAGCKLENRIVSDDTWMNIWRHEHGKVIPAMIEEYMEMWLRIGYRTKEEFEKDVDQYYRENKIPGGAQPAFDGYNKALKPYCKQHNIDFIPSATHRLDTINTTTKRVFKKIGVEVVPVEEINPTDYKNSVSKDKLF